ncbi:hypothetical protein RE137_005380 [Klebsiella pneumoniae]|nr:hypothetical protein [Klebsiella pneumoniae]ELH4087380.1 hypothetical protein [Klebsiella pneumoniae]MCD9683557.1 hypothetical protein [Klebsiella pneumoniae]
MINVTKQNKPSYECMIIAETSLSLANQEQNSSLKNHHLYTGIIFLCFAVEAMFIFYRKQVEPGYNKKDDKTKRKQKHKETSRLCGIDDMLGTREYQTIDKCFSIRDSIAHGDSFSSCFNFIPSGEENYTIPILSHPSEQFRAITPSLLKDAICAAKHIDTIIHSTGYNTAYSSNEQQFIPPLTSAFGHSGISTWHIE